MTDHPRPVPAPPKSHVETHVTIQADRTEQEPSTDVSVRRNDFWKITPITAVVKVRGLDGRSVITQLRRAMELAEKQLIQIDNHVSGPTPPDEINKRREAMHHARGNRAEPVPLRDRSSIPGGQS